MPTTTTKMTPTTDADEDDADVDEDEDEGGFCDEMVHRRWPHDCLAQPNAMGRNFLLRGVAATVRGRAYG